MEKYKCYSTLLVGLGLLLASSVVACSGLPPATESPPPESPPPSEQLAKKPAEFEVGNLLTTPSIAEVGQEVIVTADVTNTGEVEGTYSAALIINESRVGTKELTVGAGDTEAVSFMFATPGNGILLSIQ